MKHRIGVALLVACCSLCAWSQGRDDGQRTKPPPYTGGGIRGALAPVPDGVLVTGAEAQEFMGEAGYNEAAPLRPRGVIPSIEILQPLPEADLKVRTTFAISLQFRSQADAAILPASFRVLYGANRVDITSRIVNFAHVTAQGVILAQVKVPPGKHKLVFQVEDEKQRVAERELRFEAE
jgi:hypothetical protein